MAISIQVNEKRIKGRRSPMLYGHFIEHFHRQIYNGIYDPQNPLSDEDGLRSDILSAMRQIKVPVLRWPGGCFVSSYHWKDGVGKNVSPSLTRHGAWRIPTPSARMNTSKCAGKLAVSLISAPMPEREPRKK